MGFRRVAVRQGCQGPSVLQAVPSQIQAPQRYDDFLIPTGCLIHRSFLAETSLISRLKFRQYFLEENQVQAFLFS